ncbi:hypothetical protein Prudu_021354 [Prunus dulcis]|uniref:hAT-like transposase RNase-H fold domain-containing protein n=1 Tax=Prunus dulcis TaxID=3755 RepID=A0A4Y1RX79_PRUDU|nr:hypothetical protein Prudu_021354 [Prunus dulcis]
MLESIKYVRGPQWRKHIFLDCAALVSLDCKNGSHQDVPTRWNSTFLMIDSALYYQRAFLHLQLSDSNYKHFLSEVEWQKLEKLNKTKYTTANMYFPQVFVVEDTLRKAKINSDDFMRSMATQMMEKFDKLYGTNSQEMAKVRDIFCSLFDLYMQIHFESESIDGTSSTSSGVRSHVDDMVSKECMDVMKFIFDYVLLSIMLLYYYEFDTFDSEESITSSQKSQLQLYLDEPKVDRKINLNVLAFWRANQF